jgi:hypothetical protein
MSPSAQELDAARKACGQATGYIQFERQFSLLGWLSWVSRILFCGYWATKASIQNLFFLEVLFIIFLIWELFSRGFDCYRRPELKQRNSTNLRLLDDLRQKYGSEFPVGIPEERPLFEAWNRRLEKRALLWRLDAFLSRKSTRDYPSF